MLRWIKLWDAKVFGKPKAQGRAAAMFGLGGNAAAPSGSGGGGKGTFFANRPKPTTPGGGGGDDEDGPANKRQRTEGGGAQYGNNSNSDSSNSGGGGGYGKDRYRKQPGGGPGGPGGGNPNNTGPAGLPNDGWPWGFRADSRVLLLAGGPGLGKTTLAHIAAKTAGYRVMEINASDERSGKTLRQRVIDAHQTAPAFGDARPVLVVVDECDGMESGPGGGVRCVRRPLRFGRALRDTRFTMYQALTPHLSCTPLPISCPPSPLQ